MVFVLVAAEFAGVIPGPITGFEVVEATGLRGVCAHEVIDKALVTHRRKIYCFIVAEDTLPNGRLQLHHHVGII